MMHVDLSMIDTPEEKKEREERRAYLDELPEYDGFVLPNNDIDGLVPSAKVKSWEYLLKVFQGPHFKKTKNDLIYRGHCGHDWQLESTLGRMFGGGDIPQEKSDSLLNQFTLSMRGRGYDLAPLQTGPEIWAVGQHYGLKTPLLDWTRSPFVALFFAFSKPETRDDARRNPSRAIFCLNKTKIEEDLGGAFGDALFFEPKDHQNSRLVNQSGLFTVTQSGQDSFVSLLIQKLDEADLLGSVDETRMAVDDSNEDKSDVGFEVLEKAWAANAGFEVSDLKRAKLLAQYVFKLHIPNSIEDRKDCLEALRQMNIHHGNLFPDPGGASDFCNDWLERLIEDEDREAATERFLKGERKADAAVISQPSVDVIENILTILNAYLEISEEDVTELANDIKKSAEEATSLDWKNFRKKTILVKKAISQSVARGTGTIKAGHRPEDLIGELLEAFSNATG